MSHGDKVWIFDEECIGVILQYGTYFSKIHWFKDGIEHEEYLENEEFIEYQVVDYENN
jgi:hypothetical protein